MLTKTYRMRIKGIEFSDLTIKKLEGLNSMEIKEDSCFKVGDRVRVVRRPFPHELKRIQNTWLNFMDGFVGEESKIISIDSKGGIRLEGSYTFPEEVLDLV